MYFSEMENCSKCDKEFHHRRGPMLCPECEYENYIEEKVKNNFDWFFDYDENTVYQIANPRGYITYPSEVEAIKGGIQYYLDMAEQVREKFADKLKDG